MLAVGVSTFVGVGFMIFTTPINGVVFSFMSTMRKDKMEKTDRRVKLMNEVLDGIRIIKYYAWENAFVKSISEIRSAEIKVLETIGYVFSTAMALLLLGAPNIQTGKSIRCSYCLYNHFFVWFDDFSIYLCKYTVMIFTPLVYYTVI